MVEHPLPQCVNFSAKFAIYSEKANLYSIWMVESCLLRSNGVQWNKEYCPNAHWIEILWENQLASKWIWSPHSGGESKEHHPTNQSRSQRPRSFWSATGIRTSDQMGFWVCKSRTSGYTAQNQGQTPNCHVVGYFNFRLLCLCFSTFQQPIGIGLEMRLARGPDSSSAWQKGPLGTRLPTYMQDLLARFGFSIICSCRGLILDHANQHKINVACLVGMRDYVLFYN